jgi:transketolase
MADVIRTLSVDAVERASSGHPGGGARPAARAGASG